MRRLVFVSLLLLLLGLTGCEPAYPAQSPAALQRSALLTASATPPPTATPTDTPTPTPLPTAQVVTLTPTATATPTLSPSATPSPTPLPTDTPTATPTPTATALPLCSERMPDGDLFTLVTRTYGMSRAYEPDDLVRLDQYFPYSVTLGYETRIRALILPPLRALIDEMIAQGLRPTLISGYRSYSEQAIAWNKWMQQYPENAPLLSARPGTSEHQLGTTVDFGSPELENEFHTLFYATSEGQWLLTNAQRFGFTLSYPREAFELTQFYFEPWHYRYIGVELATQLYNEKRTLTEYLLSNRSAPCVPDN